MEPKPLDIAVAIPALNERENLELLLPSLWAVTKRLGLMAEIIVVDGGAPHGTHLAAEQLGARLVPQQERAHARAAPPPPPRRRRALRWRTEARHLAPTRCPR